LHTSPRSIQRTHLSRNFVLYAQSIQPQEQHVEPRTSASPPAGNACRKRPLLEAQYSTPPDLQLSLSPTTAVDGAKKRKTTAAAGEEQEIIHSSELSISLSLSPPAAASMQQQQPPREKTRRSSGSGEAVLGQSTLDLTMSIRALE
jgi:hypothetical protein